MLQTNRLALLLAATLSVMSAAEQALATAYTWNVAGPANWTSAGNWTPGGGPPTTGDTGAINSGTAVVDAALTGSPNITVDGTSGGTLLWNTVAGPATSGTITVQNSGLLQWQGNTTNATSITLDSGARIGKLDWFDQRTSKDNITIASGATVYANAIRAFVPMESGYRLELGGSLSGNGTTTLVVKPGLYTGAALTGYYGQGMLRIAPSSANTSFTGTVQVEGLSSSEHGILSLGGTGALSNASLVLNNFASLHFASPTDPFGTGAATISVGGTDRLWWDTNTGTTYTGSTATLSLANGAALGKWYQFDKSVIKENIAIQSGATVYADGIQSYIPIDSNYRLEVAGTLSGDSTTKIVVKPNASLFNSPLTGYYGNGQLRLGTSASGFAGTVQVEGLSASSQGILGLAGTGALTNATLVLGNYASLVFSGPTDPFGTGPATISVLGTDRLWWDSNTGTTYTNTATMSLANGAGLGKFYAFDKSVIKENISIQSGATIYADAIQSYIPIDGTYRLDLAGALSGDSTTKIVVKPNLYTGNSFYAGTYAQGEFRIAPTSANTSFQGTVQVDGVSATSHGILALGGTGALSNGTLVLNNYASLVFAGPTNPFGTGAATINVGGTDRLWWEGGTGSTYTGSTATLSLANGAALGKYSSFAPDTIKENLSIQSGATVYVDAIQSYIPGEVAFGLTLSGALSGGLSTTLAVQNNLYTGVNYGQGVFRIAPTAVGGNTGFSGTVSVSGTSATEGSRGVLDLAAIGALGTGKLDVQANGQAAVTVAGALDGVTSAAVHNGGILRFRNSGGSIFANATLKGDGLVRAESSGSVITTDTGLQTLFLSNVIVSPGFSIGTLTMQATTVTLGSGSALDIQLGTLADKLVVVGNLVLTAGSALDLSDLPGLTTGTYTIATYSGTLSGQFGSIMANLPIPYYLAGINYGSLNNGSITLTIGYVPEPTTGMLAMLGVATTLGFRRRRQRD